MPGNRKTIWSGTLEWYEKSDTGDQSKVPHQVPCFVTAKENDADIQGDNWPPRLLMQLMSKQLIGSIGQSFLKESKSVSFHPSACESLENLTKVMSSGFAGCVTFNQPVQPCDIRVLILFYSVEKKAFLGFIPNNQAGFVDKLRKVISQKQVIGRQGQPGPMSGNIGGPIQQQHQQGQGQGSNQSMDFGQMSNLQAENYCLKQQMGQMITSLDIFQREHSFMKDLNQKLLDRNEELLDHITILQQQMIQKWTNDEDEA